MHRIENGGEAHTIESVWQFSAPLSHLHATITIYLSLDRQMFLCQTTFIHRKLVRRFHGTPFRLYGTWEKRCFTAACNLVVAVIQSLSPLQIFVSFRCHRLFKSRFVGDGFLVQRHARHSNGHRFSVGIQLNPIFFT